MGDRHVVAKTQPEDEFYQEVLSTLSGIVDATRRETGCKRFELNVGTEGGWNLYLVEIWQDDEALKAHHEMPHTVEAAARIDGKLAGATEVVLMEPVD